MSDTHTTATPETTNAAPTAHPPVRENQQPVEAEVKQDEIASQRVVSAIGGGSPATPPEQFSGALGGLSGRSQTGLLRQLQRSYGNHYVGSVIQRKADSTCSCDECEKKEKEIQRKGEGEVNSVPDGFEAAMQRSGAGQPLDEGTRSFMESRFGEDFGDVKVHTDSAAAEASQQIQAQAFTTRRNIYFGQGLFQPQATEGKKLLAHELTHVVQQTGGIQNKLIVGQSGNAYEREADNIAEKLVADTSKIQTANNINVSKLNAPVVQRQEPPNNPPINSPTPDPEAEKKALEERHQKAFDAVQARVGQAAATVLFSNPVSPETMNSPIFETFTVGEILDRHSESPIKHGFESQGTATAYTALMGGEIGGAVLLQDGFFFAAKLNKGSHKLRVADPSWTWTEGDWYFGRDHVYRVTASLGVVSITGMGGFVFPLGKDLMDDPTKTRFIKDPSMATPADAESMRGIAGAAPIGQDGKTNLKLSDQVDIPEERQEAFIFGYFRARGLEVLSSNEKETERLTEVFMPTVPGSGAKAPSGLSSEAQKMIAANREQLKVYSKLLEEEAQVEALLSFLEVCEERGEFPPFYPVYVKPQKAQVDTMSKVIKARQADIQQRKIGILGASPLIGQLVGMPDPKSRFQKAERIPGNIVENIQIPQVRGTSYSSVNESLLAKPTTPENEETIRAEFLKKLDAVRKAIRDTRSEMLGDSDFLLGMEGLRLLVTQDLNRITGKNAGLIAKLKKLLQMHKVKEKRWEKAEFAIQIGLLFIPGAGPFLSAMAGFVMSAEHLSTNLRRWSASQSSVNPATALVDQQMAETQLAQNTIDLTIIAVFLATDAINALKKLDTAAGGKKLESAFQQIEKQEVEQVTAKGTTASGHVLEVSGKGIERCSPRPCPLLRNQFAPELAEDTARGGDLEKKLSDAENLRLTDPEGALQASKAVEVELVALRGRVLVGEAVYNRLRNLGLDGNAIQRILAKGTDVNNIKGRLFDELFAIEAKKKMGSTAGREALAGAGADPVVLGKDLQFWPGSKITDIHGQELTDGILGYLDGRDLHIVNVFEAKAGQKVSTQLRVLEERMTRLATEGKNLAHIDKYAKDFWEELRALAEKEGKPFDLTVADIKDELMRYRTQKELGGQVRQTIERLDISVDPIESATGNIHTRILLDGEEVNVVGISGKTRVTGVLPKDVKPGKMKDVLTKEGLNFDIMKMDISAKEVEDLAIDISGSAKNQQLAK